jgi:predicted alpha/beta-hydrolase family hydrolase
MWDSAYTGGMKLLRDGPEAAETTLVLAHGAGAPMDHAFMNDMAARLAGRGLGVVRFNFPYMQERRRMPDRMPVLEACMREVVAGLGDPKRLLLGGKSMGSRVASQLADALGVRGAVALGYPFHPPDKPQQLRTQHLTALRTPFLIVQGTRDVFGTPQEIRGYPLSPAVELCLVEDGDHGLEPRKASGRTLEQNLTQAADAIAAFAARLSR